MTDQFPLEVGADPETVVAKSNDLVRGRHEFSTLEQRIFVAMVAQLNRETEFPVVEIPLGEVCELSGPDVDQLYEDAREAIESTHGDASDTYLESMTAQKMEALWEGN